MQCINDCKRYYIMPQATKYICHFLEGVYFVVGKYNMGVKCYFSILIYVQQWLFACLSSWNNVCFLADTSSSRFDVCVFPFVCICFIQNFRHVLSIVCVHPLIFWLISTLFKVSVTAVSCLLWLLFYFKICLVPLVFG